MSQSMNERLGNTRVRKAVSNHLFPDVKGILIINIWGEGCFFFVKERKVDHMRNKSQDDRNSLGGGVNVFTHTLSLSLKY